MNQNLISKTIKMVIRHLPPDTTLVELRKQLYDINEEEILYLAQPRHKRLDMSFSTLYLEFCSFKKAFDFQKNYDGILLNDKNGKTYTAIVELAPFQQSLQEVTNMREEILKKIEDDDSYKNFENKPTKKISSNQDDIDANESVNMNERTSLIESVLSNSFKLKLMQSFNSVKNKPKNYRKKAIRVYTTVKKIPINNQVSITEEEFPELS
ncbi:hypothetical protein HZS_1963 [Henneguya salminicola]|nr:hypothetical protein HZS_1963 [Henneguya salminicola]